MSGPKPQKLLIKHLSVVLLSYVVTTRSITDLSFMYFTPMLFSGTPTTRRQQQCAWRTSLRQPSRQHRERDERRAWLGLGDRSGST